MRIIWSPLALDRVEAIAREVAGDRPAVAGRWVDGLFDLVARLRRYPELGRVVQELTRDDIRELPFASHRVFYRVDPKRIVILTIRHARQDRSLEELANL